MTAPDWIDALPRGRCLAEVSMWSADLLALGPETDRATEWGDILHVDVADGAFAPALLFFPDLVAQMRARTRAPIHVHLMIDDAILLAQVDQFLDAGADLVSVHAEARGAPEALARIAARGAVPGLVLQVGTPVAAARPLLERCRVLTLLGTAIGVKGQGLSGAALGRLREARAMLDGLPGARRLLAADGAIRETTVPDLHRAGADTVVMGSLFFGAEDLAARMAWLRSQRRA